MAEKSHRRKFLNRTLLGAAAAGAAFSLEERILLAALEQQSDQQTQPPAESEPMPCGQVGNVKVSRLLIGGNLIGGWAHSRDLIYASRLFRAYNTEEKIQETLALAEQHGINTIQADPRCMDSVVKYNQQGGKMQSLVCIMPDANEAKMAEQIKVVMDQGATMLYTHGGASEPHVRDGRIEVIAKCLELMRRQGVPAGIGSHSLEVPIACEKHGLNPDFYVKTFHSDRYWSATPEENREEWCWHRPTSGEHGTYFDNMWCLDPERTAQFMQSIQRPWFAFKVLAAGALHPRVAVPYAFRNGADFVILGMFDFQIAEDASIVRATLRKLDQRDRPWMA